MRRSLEIPDIPFTAAEANRLGLSRRQLSNAVDNRLVRRVLSGVYVRADVPDTPQLRARAALLVVSPFTVLCDRTAAWLHGVSVFDLRELEILPVLETYVLRGNNPTHRPECYSGSRDLRREDICVVEGVSVTTPLRTAVDLGCKLSRNQALAALDSFMRLHDMRREEMEAMLTRYFRRRGVVQLRQLVPLADPRAESTGESWTRLAILDGGLPAPEPQYWVYVDGRPTYRIDLAYVRSRVAVEYDGVEYHTTPEQRAYDLERRTWLKEHGWTVIVVDKDSFTAEAIGDWRHELRRALRLVA